MGWRALGDSAWLFEPGGTDVSERLGRVLGLRAALDRQRIREVTDVVSAFESVSVHFDPSDGGTVLDWLLGLPPSGAAMAGEAGARYEFPVAYGGHGTDLDEVAAALGMSAAEVISIHCGAEYPVAALGFSPGFPYLSGLDARLALRRRSTPRPVPAGAVAIANGQAGIYPTASQGGWHVLGRTDARLFDPRRPLPALLRPGDRVRFVPVGGIPRAREAEQGPIMETGIGFLESGAFTTVQDLGRPGYRAAGVIPGGAADPVAARVANRLVGNPDDAAVLECSGSGPVLRMETPATVAWMGWAEGSGVPHGFPAGAVVDLKARMNHSWGYIAVAGGIDAPIVLGGRATDVRAGFGGWKGRALCKHDRLAIGSPARPAPRAGEWRVGWPRAERSLRIRFITGMQASWFGEADRKTFCRSIYRTSATGDRTGMRLNGPLLGLAKSRELISQPVVAGSIQVPPDGMPIVLMVECQTIGGYPQIGHVISADLPALARALPGTPVSFEEVTLDEARAAWHDLRRELGFQTAGLACLG
jgi:KipI family sensor histidine kinase inhibitor